MIGLYFLAVIVLWLLLTTWLFRRGWRLYRTRSGSRPLWGGGLAVIALIWLSVSFWYAGGRKIYYDLEVQRLCAIDGGVKVYEQVNLPAERFDKYGNVNVPHKDYAKSSDVYHFETEIKYLRRGNPSIERAKTIFVRRSDGRVLGESVRYGRGGGDLPGPWHGSSFDCPSISKAEGQLERSVFGKQE